MEIKNETFLSGPSCSLVRNPAALQAMFSLAWRKGKKERPLWLLKELDKFC